MIMVMPGAKDIQDTKMVNLRLPAAQWVLSGFGHLADKGDLILIISIS